MEKEKDQSLNHLSVHWWIRSAIHASNQLASPIVSYDWNCRHFLVRYYWYMYVYLKNTIIIPEGMVCPDRSKT